MKRFDHLKKLTRWLILIGLALMAFQTAPCTAQDHVPVTYYVSPNGNDVNDGLSESRPLKDLASAMYRMQLGDTLIVLPGEYEVVDFRASCKDPWKNKMYLGKEGGSAEIRTTIKGKPGLPRPKIKALKTDGSIGGLQYNGAVGITIEHLDIHGGLGYGRHMVYRDCILGGQGTVYAISAEHHNTLIENNYIHDIYGGGDAIGIYIHGSDNVIRNNFFKNMTHHGFQTYNANRLVIENNIITQTEGHGIAFRDMHDSIIRNNVLVNVGSQAISFGGTSSSNIKVIGNTIYNGDGKGYYGLFFINDVEGLVLENNIIVHKTPITFTKDTQLAPAKLASYTFRNNLIYNPYRGGREELFFIPGKTFDLKGWQQYTAGLLGNQGLSQGSIAGDPKVISPPTSGVDYMNYDGSSHINVRLKADSPAIDAGIASALLTVDADGNARPQGRGTDMGAHEYLGASPPPPVEIPGAPMNLRIVE